ncbi:MULTISPECIES: phosphate ABC transporter permease PstA [Thermotoga]|uniref:Phosphate transport system permease protein PstA n=1 Tax=Thermotoga neapolitana (strain ATCC 49049 / DSM 4359 / NBRC 107923 / NS-E) TaxID=309803 RepID=B9K954_THENN|nr:MULTISPECIES: phosphate ABC transporter permease PstA [Thermotoga]MDK2786183.1 phosphate transport system permease protein [Thermotoga sp.]ACB09894.1 phosphate ABC transporter, inner membrane subunit PstA [Thermotoga sp. RQ2]ACM23487.1 Phosphate ABC transporter, inner membrane subunit PstA [Thermotoga neapolitana DSM 4359]KFZ21120.1 phosphate ABC transporter permease [Thermotoga neapolitana LA10]MDK2950159.1 phosphate transport system permease protein [Thermotoga sp.]
MKKDLIISYVFRVVSYVVFAVVLFLFVSIVAGGAKYFSPSFFLDYPRSGMTEGGIFPAILGSFYLMALTFLISIPLGIFTGVFLSEYGENVVARWIDISLTALSGIPSVVYGLFGLAFFCVALQFGTSMIAAALTLSLMTLPVIASSTKETLKAIPVEIREAALALGAKKEEVIFKVLLPAARRGIITAVLVGGGRALGETAPVLLTGAVFYSTELPKGLFSPVMTLPTHIYYITAAYGESAQWMAKGTAAFLMIIVALIYGAAFFLRRRENGTNN